MRAGGWGGVRAGRRQHHRHEGAAVEEARDAHARQVKTFLFLATIVAKKPYGFQIGCLANYLFYFII